MYKLLIGVLFCFFFKSTLEVCLFSLPVNFKSEVKDKYDTCLTRNKVKEMDSHYYKNIIF